MVDVAKWTKHFLNLCATDASKGNNTTPVPSILDISVPSLCALEGVYLVLATLTTMGILKWSRWWRVDKTCDTRRKKPILFLMNTTEVSGRDVFCFHCNLAIQYGSLQPYYCRHLMMCQRMFSFYAYNMNNKDLFDLIWFGIPRKRKFVLLPPWVGYLFPVGSCNRVRCVIWLFWVSIYQVRIFILTILKMYVYNNILSSMSQYTITNEGNKHTAFPQACRELV